MDGSAEDRALRRSFDAVAEVYAREFADELGRKPFDRDILTRFAETAAAGRVLDVGCGPAQVGAFVAECGPAVTGVDFSASSLAQGAAMYPYLSFVCADVRALPFAPSSIAGILSFYCLIYLSESELPAVFGEWRRVLEGGAPLLVAVHGGEGEDHFDDFRGIPIDVTIRWRDPDRLAACVEKAGFAIEDVTVRDPYPEEHPSRRIYLAATAV